MWTLPECLNHKFVKHQLAQINIARLLAPIDDPLVAGFVAQLDTINTLAESSNGFVWRLKDESGNATDINPFDDPMLIVNMSVWESVEDLKSFAYHTDHIKVFKDRAKWFEKPSDAHMVLWWIPQGEFPSVEEAKDRLMHLRKHGESDYAFSFRKIFPAPANP